MSRIPPERIGDVRRMCRFWGGRAAAAFRLDVDDAASEGMLGVVAAKEVDWGDRRWTGYVRQAIRWAIARWVYLETGCRMGVRGDRFNGARRYRMVSVDSFGDSESGEDRVYDVVDEAPLQDALLIFEERKARIHLMLGISLSSALEGTIGEASERLGITPNAVVQRRMRAARKVKRTDAA